MESTVVTVWMTSDEASRLKSLIAGTGVSPAGALVMVLNLNPGAYVKPRVRVGGPFIVPITMRVQPSDLEWLDELAAMRGESRSEILRQLLASIESVNPPSVELTDPFKEAVNVA
jgi:hypothetical protein